MHDSVLCEILEVNDSMPLKCKILGSDLALSGEVSINESVEERIEKLLDSLTDLELLKLIDDIKDEQELRKLKNSRQKKLKLYLKKERIKILKDLEDLSEEESSKPKAKKVIPKKK